MTPVDLGTIKKVLLQEVWKKEATDFTPWLAANLSYLAEILGMELTLETTECSVGDFSADIVARDLSTGRRIIIENQYWQTDHKHLGQVLTYAAGLGVGAVVWIAEDIRPEHRIAIDFLNRGMGSALRFYALEMQVIKIDESRPAFTLDIICEPGEDPEASANLSGRLTERELKYAEFFQSLVDTLSSKHFTNARKAQPQNWFTFSSDVSGIFTYTVSFAQQGKVRAEVYIDCSNKAQNKRIFDELLAHRAEIEVEFGSSLNWERLDKRRACRIAIYRPGNILATPEELDEIKHWSVENLERLKKVFRARNQEAWQAVESEFSDEGAE